MTDFDVFDEIEKYDREHGLMKSVEGVECVESSVEGVIPECLHESVSDYNGPLECVSCYNKIESINDDVKDEEEKTDSSRCWMPKKKVKGIFEDLKGYDFSDPIINKTSEMYEIVTQGKLYRVDKRKSIIVKCLMEAHKILGENVTLESLLEKIPVKNVTFGMKIVEMGIKKFDVDRTRITYTTPEDSIKDILAKWDTDQETVDNIIKLYNSISNKSSLINRSRSTSVAAASIYYYALITKRDNIKLKDFAERVNLSGPTIERLAKEISAILKTPHILKYELNKNE